MRVRSGHCRGPHRRFGERTWTVLGGGVLIAASTLEAGTVPQPKMGDALLGLSAGQLARFDAGMAAFQRVFTEPEGLGPIFNQNSCSSCHGNPLGGPGTVRVTRAGSEDKFGFDPLEEFGGSLFQQETISEDCREVIPPEATIVIRRITNGMLGYGLIEAIPDADIEFYQLNPPSPEVSGRVHWVESFEDPPGTLRAGRFGWKAQVATILTFSADAALNEMGLTSPFPQTSQENDPNGIHPPNLGDPDFCDDVPDPEVGMDFLQQLTDFQRFLAAPPQTPKSGMAGEAIFSLIGCTDCHIPSFTTAKDRMLERAIRNKVVRPYSDFLLHDMGLTADFIEQGDAQQRELKTPPLAGLRKRDPIWHDGRFEAGTLRSRAEDAIAAHNVTLSEGRAAAQAYAALTPAEQDAVIAFLDSLGRREFDHDGNDIVDLDDFIIFASCYEGGPYTPDDPCAISDVDQNAEVTFPDVVLFLSVYSGPQADCNNNGVLDLLDILLDVSNDTNANGVPDECDCLADLSGNGRVDVPDLLALLAAWGVNPGHPADLDGDGYVGWTDLIDLTATWGACP